MLTAEGCRRRRQRLWDRLDPKPDGDHLRLADPIHLMYLANFHVDPFSLGAGFGGVLATRRDGHAKLLHDNRLPESASLAHVEERVEVPWYDGQSPGGGWRQLALLGDVNPAHSGVRVHDRPGDPYASVLVGAIASMRRRKDSDEIALLKRCMRAGEAGHKRARAVVKPGMTELDVYCEVNSACIQAVGRPVIVYGDFVVSPGPERRGGPATDRVLQAGDMLILDFSVVIDGYRGDFTNTLVVGREPTAEQQRLYDLCMEAWPPVRRNCMVEQNVSRYMERCAAYSRRRAWLNTFPATPATASA